MNKILVIIPTFNESQSIQIIIEKILKINNNYDILVVDDNSPDKTYNIVNDIIEFNNRVKLIVRDKKGGIGKAYCVGFEYAIKNNYDKVIQIDADLSHNPIDIPRLIKYSSNYDLVIGSRYINGISIVNWPLSRLILSYCGNLYAKFFTRMNIHDCTGGFKCISIDILKKINLNKVNSQGYSFQVEFNYLTYINKFKIIEIPIIFTDRKIGKSKMSKRIIIEAIFVVPYLRIKNLLRI